MDSLGTFCGNFQFLTHEFSHTFAVFENLPHAIFLGMDFITQKGLVLDGHSRTITLGGEVIPSTGVGQSFYPLCMVMVTEIAPRATKQVEMIVDYPRASKVGVIMPDVYAPHASQMLVWSGLQNCCRIGGVKVWITNLLNKTIMLEQGERVAWWIPMEMERIQTAELAWQEAKRRLGSKRFASSYVLSKPTLAGRETQTLRQGDSDPLWCDDSHLSLNVDGVALLERDPLPNASLEDLRAFLLRLNEKIASSPDSEQLPGMYSQAARICVRIKGVKECQEDGEGELLRKWTFQSTTTTSRRRN
jgi:hypothetical protein